MERDDKTTILIVEDEAILAMSLKFLIELGGPYRVVGIAADLGTSLQLAREFSPSIALVDIQLANGCSGIDVASELVALGVRCMFMTGNRPPEPRPEIAVGCLSKPFSDEALFAALSLMCKPDFEIETVKNLRAYEIDLY